MSFFHRVDTWYTGHRQHISTVALAALIIAVLGFGTPLMLLADQLSPPPTSDTFFCAALGRQATTNECGMAASQQPGSASIFCDVLGKQTTKDECDMANGQQAGSTIIFCEALGKQTTKDECDGATTLLPDSTIIFCNILGKRTTKGECPSSNNGSQQPQQNNNQQNQPQQNNQPGQQGGNQQRGQQGPGNGQQGQGQGQGGNQQGNQSGDQQNGPSAKQQAQQFSQMKSKLKQMGLMLKQITLRVTKMEAGGNVVSGDIKTNITTAQSDLNVIMTAKTMDDPGVQDAMDDLQSKSGNLNQAMQTLQQLSQFSQIVKQAASQIKKLDTAFVSAQKLAARSKVDVNGEISQFSQAVSDIKVSLQQAKDSAASGDVETAMQTLQDDVFGKLQDAAQFPTIIRTIQNVSSNISKFNNFLNRAKRMLVSRTKAGDDTIDLSASIETFSADLDQLKAIVAQPSPDTGELSDAVNTIFSDQNDLQSMIGGSSVIQMPATQNVKEFQSLQNFSLPFGSQNGQMGGNGMLGQQPAPLQGGAQQ